MAARYCSEYAIRGPYWMPLFCTVCDLVGMEEAMVWMIGRSLLFEAVLEQVFARTLAYCERFLAACGDSLDILYLGDDFATQRGMMISPAHWRLYLKPRYARLFELGKRAGKFVWFHACGDITPVLPDLIDIGVDVWETVQLHTLPMSATQLKREFGRHLTFFGGINTQRLPFASPADIEEEVERCIRALGQGGGYICGPDHHIKPDVPVANTLALFDGATGFRSPGYTLG
jgi:uroporphyrinogen decarboxylase